MSKQLEKILSYGEVEAAMVHLAEASGLPSASHASGSHARLAPIVVEAMTDAGQSPAAFDELLIAARGLSWVERTSPEVLFENNNASFGHGLGQVIFGAMMPELVSTIAANEGLGETYAAVLLEVIAAVSISVMAGLPDNPLSAQSLEAALAGSDVAETSSPSAAVAPMQPTSAEPVLPEIVQPETVQPEAVQSEVVQSEAVPAGVAKAEPVAGAEPTPASDGNRSKKPMLVGAVVALLAVAGLGFVLLSGGSGDVAGEEPETLALDVEAPTTTAVQDSVSEEAESQSTKTESTQRETGETEIAESESAETETEVETESTEQPAEVPPVGDEVDVAEQTVRVETDGGGAAIVLDGGTVFLEGGVPDQATADELFGSVSGIDSATPVVNNLTVDPDAPLPSGRVVIADAVFFDVASAEISIDEVTLSAITALALSREDWVLTVVGHTDARGTQAENLDLSLRRATALRDLLAEQGVPEENLRIRGAGETVPIADNSVEAGRAENRRIEFEFTPKS